MNQNSFQDILNKQKTETQQKIEKRKEKETIFTPYVETEPSESQLFRSLLSKRKQSDKKKITISLNETTFDKMEKLGEFLDFHNKSKLISELIEIAYQDVMEKS